MSGSAEVLSRAAPGTLREGGGEGVSVGVGPAVPAGEQAPRGGRHSGPTSADVRHGVPDLVYSPNSSGRAVAVLAVPGDTAAEALFDGNLRRPGEELLGLGDVGPGGGNVGGIGGAMVDLRLAAEQGGDLVDDQPAATGRSPPRLMISYPHGRSAAIVPRAMSST